MYQQVIVVGHLGKDPEIRYSSDGTAFANFSIAATDTWKDRSSGEKKEVTEWFQAVAAGRLAEICGEYLRKGHQGFFVGKMRTRKWQAKDGTDKYTTEFRIDELRLLKNGENRTYRNDDGFGGGSSSEAPARKPVPKKAPTSGPIEDMDDDIPF